MFLSINANERGKDLDLVLVLVQVSKEACGNES